MKLSSPRTARHAPPAHSAAPDAAEPTDEDAPRRRLVSRKARLLTILAPSVAVLLVGVALLGIHRPTEKQTAGGSAVKPVTSLPSCCVSSAISSHAPSPSPSRKHQAAKHAGQKGSLPGAVMPADNIPGWHLEYSQNFDGDSLPPGWGAYTGQPGGDSYGYWDPANVSVSGGELHLRTTPNGDPNSSGASSSGGVGFYGNPQTYGLYLVRLKGDAEPGLKMSDIALLWPSSGQNWPPELDFFEDSGGQREVYSATVHPGPDGNDCCIVREFNSTTGTQWHTYGIEWTPTTITYLLDGKQWGSVIYRNSIAAPGQWPSMDMNLDLQSQNLSSDQPSGSIETMTVDWVAEYSMAG